MGGPDRPTYMQVEEERGIFAQLIFVLVCAIPFLGRTTATHLRKQLPHESKFPEAKGIGQTLMTMRTRRREICGDIILQKNSSI